MLTLKRKSFSACNNLRNHAKRQVNGGNASIMVNTKFPHTQLRKKRQFSCSCNKGDISVLGICVAVALKWLQVNKNLCILLDGL